jgi:ankyrin repeat protein
MLIEAGANAQHQSETGFSPLHLAVGDDCLRVLLEFRKRIDLDQRLRSGGTALISAAQDRVTPIGHTKLLGNAGSNPNAKDEAGYTALCFSVLCKNWM